MFHLTDSEIESILNNMPVDTYQVNLKFEPECSEPQRGKFYEQLSDIAFKHQCAFFDDNEDMTLFSFQFCCSLQAFEFMHEVGDEMKNVKIVSAVILYDSNSVTL